MSERIVKTFEAADGHARLWIFERDDGLFCFQGERQKTDVYRGGRRRAPSRG